MDFKPTEWKRFDLFVVGLALLGIILLTICVVYITKPVNSTPEESIVIFSKPVIVDADPVQLTDPDSTLTEIDIPEFTEYVDPEPVYTPEPTNPPATEPQEYPSEPAETPESDDYDSDEYSEDVEMLACVIYCEAGSDSICDDCRRYVGDVVLNRVADPRFPDTIYGVLTAEGQYGRFHWTGIVWPERAHYSSEAHAVERAYRIAQEVLNGQHSSLYGNGYVWQAGFVQGTEGFWCCGHYFAKG